MKDSVLENELKIYVGDAFANLTEMQRALCVTRYRAQRCGYAIYLWWFFNVHYAYVRQWKLCIAFVLTFGGLGLWWIIDLFRITAILERRNSEVATHIVGEITAEAS